MHRLNNNLFSWCDKLMRQVRFTFLKASTMSVHVGHLAFFSLAADLRPLQNKMFATKTSCTIQFFDIFNEMSIRNRPRELLYCKARNSLAQKNCRTRHLAHRSITRKQIYDFVQHWKFLIPQNGCENSPGELSCFFAVQNRWGARENHGEWKREYNSTRTFIPIFITAIGLKL